MRSWRQDGPVPAAAVTPTPRRHALVIDQFQLRRQCRWTLELDDRGSPILVVEDNRFLCEMICDWLQGAGYIVARRAERARGGCRAGAAAASISCSSIWTFARDAGDLAAAFGSE